MIGATNKDVLTHVLKILSTSLSNFFKAYRNLNFMATQCTNLRKLLVEIIFSDHFRKIIIRSKRIRYNMNAMRQTVCLVVNLVTVINSADLFNCMPMYRVSDLMMAPV